MLLSLCFIIPVSYTHLDVYKRQDHDLIVRQNEAVDHDLISRQNEAVDHDLIARQNEAVDHDLIAWQKVTTKC